MRFFQSLPTTVEQQDFYNAYARFSGKIKGLAASSQIFSGLTESVIFYSIGYDTFLPFSTNIAIVSGIVAAILGVCLIELFGLRVCLPQAVNQYLFRRFKGGHLAITLFVSLLTLCLIIASFHLSLSGGDNTVKTQIDKVEEKQAAVLEGSHNSTAEQQQQITAADSTEIETRYSTLIASQVAKYQAKSAVAQTELDTWSAKKGNYITRVNLARTKLATIQAERTGTLAELESKKATEHKQIRSEHKQKQDSMQALYTLALSDNSTNYSETSATFQAATKYAVILAILLSIFCIIIECIYKKNANIQETPIPLQSDFEQGLWATWMGAAKERFQIQARNSIADFQASTPNRVAPIAPAPLLDYGKMQPIQIRLELNGQTEQIIQVAAPQIEKRQIGFKQNSYNDSSANATPNDSSESVNNVSCLNCQSDISHRRSNAKYCSDQCKFDFHAKQHGGERFNPNFKK